VRRRRGRWCAITAVRLAIVVALGACSHDPAPLKWPVHPRVRGPSHDPDHARGELPSAATRKAELAALRTNLDAIYAHRKAKLARYAIDEDALFAEAETRLVAATTWAAYDAAFYDALAKFHDGHLVYHPPQTMRPAAGYASFRLGLHTVMGKGVLLVSDVDAGSDAKTAGVAPGDEVIEIDGKPIKDVFALVIDGRASSRPESSLASYAKTWTSVLVPKGDPPRARSIRVKRYAGGELAVAIAPRPAEKGKHEAVTVTGDANVAIVTIASLEGNDKRVKQLDDAFAKARASKAIVIDLRGDRGGDIDKVGPRVLAGLAEGTALLGRYRVLVAPETIARRPKWKHLEGTGDAEGFSPPQDLVVQALDHKYPGRIAVVIDAGCVSTCEVVASALRGDLGAKLVGETTGGSSGAPVTVSLPTTRATVAIPTWNLIAVDGGSIEDDGVTPDLVVDATPDALAAGTDLPLQQAIDLVRAP
jgi:carboxyl-terminal processing protease